MSLLSKRFTCIDPGDWPAREGRLRVLVEHPDRAVLTGAVDILRDADYDVSTCLGAEHGQRCPLVDFGRCVLVEGADVVVTSPELADAEDVLDLHERRAVRTVVIELPLTPRSLRDAVAEAAAER